MTPKPTNPPNMANDRLVQMHGNIMNDDTLSVSGTVRANAILTQEIAVAFQTFIEDNCVFIGTNKNGRYYRHKHDESIKYKSDLFDLFMEQYKR